jgi:hypothetical protein
MPLGGSTPHERRPDYVQEQRLRLAKETEWSENYAQCGVIWEFRFQILIGENGRTELTRASYIIAPTSAVTRADGGYLLAAKRRLNLANAL